MPPEQKRAMVLSALSMPSVWIAALGVWIIIRLALGVTP